jgi:hypothetical protein
MPSSWVGGGDGGGGRRKKGKGVKVKVASEAEVAVAAANKTFTKLLNATKLKLKKTAKNATNLAKQVIDHADGD